jgi:glycosyltransferase involved in cell wall biosynthesis
MDADLRGRYPRAHFLGQLSGDALAQAISQASVVVVPSNCYENCPMSVLEAMAYGKPVVASAIGGIPELVVDGKTGLLFEPDNLDALRTCLSAMMADRDKRQNFGAAARKRASERFSVEHHNTALMALYQRVIAMAGAETRLGITA